jgi:hypothetical protein
MAINLIAHIHYCDPEYSRKEDYGVYKTKELAESHIKTISKYNTPPNGSINFEYINVPDPYLFSSNTSGFDDSEVESYLNCEEGYEIKEGGCKKHPDSFDVTLFNEGGYNAVGLCVECIKELDIVLRRKLNE